MSNFERKVVVSVLWMSHAVANLVQIALAAMGPHGANRIVGPRQIVIYSLTFCAQIFLAYLVLIIKDPKWNKWINFPLSIVFALLSWIDYLHFAPTIGIANIAAGFTNVPITILIFYAWKLDR